MNTTNDRFNRYIKNHKNFIGGLDRSQIPPIKTFISSEKNLLLDQAIEIGERERKDESEDEGIPHNHYRSGYNEAIDQYISKLKELKE